MQIVHILGQYALLVHICDMLIAYVDMLDPLSELSYRSLCIYLVGVDYLVCPE